MQLIENFVAGSPCSSSSDKYQAVFDPSTGVEKSNVILSTATDAENAISVAEQAFPGWRDTSPLKRARVLFRFKALLEEHGSELAKLITQEHGKVLSDSEGEITRGAEVVEFACGIPHLLKGEHSFKVGRGIESYSIMQPLGVCAGISPFNFPAMVPMWMFPIALACGNTFVMKPSEKDPSTCVRLAELLSEAGLPDGVFNVINGDKEVVDVLLTDDRVKAVSFVGSTPIAEYVYSTASEKGKRVQALGGAKNHMIIMPDADPDQVVNSLLGAAYGSAGERCMAISVAVCVGDAVADQLTDSLKERIGALHVGPGAGSPEPHMGPLISAEHAKKVRSYIDLGVEEGASLIVDGREFVSAGNEQGFFVGPTLFDNVEPGMRIYEEEIFGPVLSIVRVKSFPEGISLINKHEYGNGTAIFTRDGEAARAFVEEVDVGMVGVNVPIPVPMAFHSFGGWKRSLFGDLHLHGPDGVRFYSRMKTVTTRWPKDRGEGMQFSMPTLG